MNQVADILKVRKLHLEEVPKEFNDCEFLVASDVSNILCGPNGATTIFGPQKGVNQSNHHILERALKHFGTILEEQFQDTVLNFPGSGAAGGIGAIFKAIFKARFSSGIELVDKYTELESKIATADLIFTGEGKLDTQTLSGKVIYGVGKLASKYEKPVIALCGVNELDDKGLDTLNLIAAFSIVKGPCTVDYAIENAAELVTNLTANIVRTILIFNKGNK